MVKSRIAIVGAGWFGCHLATYLLKMGHEIAIFERTGKVFSGASGANQNRLHLGYHYPRSAQTRLEIKESHERFMREYPTKEMGNNFFAVAKDSFIDLWTYEKIMQAEGLPLEKKWASDFGIQGVEDGVVFSTKERVIDTDAVREHFADKLVAYIIKADVPSLGRELWHDGYLYYNGGCQFDGIIDCTSGELSPSDEIFFEPAVMAEYDGPTEHFSLTIMDGHFPCLYATAKPGVWRVSHVYHTARGAFPTAGEARRVLEKVNERDVTEQMTAAMMDFYPGFSQKFKPRGVVKAVRTKLKNNNASRECRVKHDGPILKVFSGKICSVFLVEKEVDKWLKTL